MSKQTPRERVLAALSGGRPERAPVGNVVSIATVELMAASGAAFPAAHTDATTMAELAAAGHELLGYDTVMPVYSVVQEAAALGCQIDWGGLRQMPAATTHRWAEGRPMTFPADWLEAPAARVVLQALALLRRRLGERALVVGKVMGPWSLSYHLHGTETFLLATLLEPERARRSLALLKEVTIQFARAQLDAGAELICLADHATGGMVSPRMYEELLLPLHQEIVARIGAPVVLHCCGDTRDRLDAFRRSGIRAYHFESAVPVETARAALGGQVALIGNLNNPTLLLQGIPQEVRRAAEAAITAGVDVLAPECAVPLETPLANLRALVAAAEGTPWVGSRAIA